MYCSRKCAHAGWCEKNRVPVMLECNRCGKEFVRLHSNAKYCSPTCSKEEERDRKKRLNKGIGKGWSKGVEYVPRDNCLTCGEKFYATPAQRRRGGGKYCSKKCKGRADSARLLSLRSSDSICKQCGKSFYVIPAKKKNGRGVFCSLQCVGAYRREVYQNKGGVYGIFRDTKQKRRFKIVCQMCSREAEVSRANGKYCSYQCRGIAFSGENNPFWTGGKPTRDCVTCGKGFRANSNLDVKRGYGKFCSRKCYMVHRSKYNNNTKSYSYARGGKRDDLGIYVRSSWEANWARYLNFLKKHGEIQDWVYEPETFEFAGIKRGSKFYTPDFLVIEKDGSRVYYEIKGYMDAQSKTKLRRMKKYHPNIKIIVVEKKQYYAVARKVRGLIPNWEIVSGHENS